MTKGGDERDDKIAASRKLARARALGWVELRSYSDIGCAEHLLEAEMVVIKPRQGRVRRFVSPEDYEAAQVLVDILLSELPDGRYGHFGQGEG